MCNRAYNFTHNIKFYNNNKIILYSYSRIFYTDFYGAYSIIAIIIKDHIIKYNEYV